MNKWTNWENRIQTWTSIFWSCKPALIIQESRIGIPFSSQPKNQKRHAIIWARKTKPATNLKTVIKSCLSGVTVANRAMNLDIFATRTTYRYNGTRTASIRRYWTINRTVRAGEGHFLHWGYDVRQPSKLAIKWESVFSFLSYLCLVSAKSRHQNEHQPWIIREHW